jgi:hypothetical protein
MSAHERPAWPAIALCASLALSLVSPTNANAGSCLSAPNGSAPQGSHWFYRIEHPSLRKCWRLVQTEPKDRTAAAQATPAPKDDAVVPPTPAVTQPVERPAEPQAVAPAPVIRTLVTRNVSNSENDATPAPPPPDPAANAAPNTEVRSAPAPVEQVVSKEPAQAAIVEPPALAPTTGSVASPSGGPTLRTLLGALAILGIFASAMFFVLQMRQRQSDVLNTAWDASEPPFVAAPEARYAPDAPSFAPLPPIGPISRDKDNIEQMLRRFAQNLKRSNA